MSKGTFNLLEDLGFPDAAELTAKVEFATKINAAIKSSGLTQIEAAKRTGIPAAKISAIRNYRMDGISLEQLKLTIMAI